MRKKSFILGLVALLVFSLMPIGVFANGEEDREFIDGVVLLNGEGNEVNEISFEDDEVYELKNPKLVLQHQNDIDGNVRYEEVTNFELTLNQFGFDNIIKIDSVKIGNDFYLKFYKNPEHEESGTYETSFIGFEIEGRNFNHMLLNLNIKWTGENTPTIPDPVEDFVRGYEFLDENGNTLDSLFKYSNETLELKNPKVKIYYESGNEEIISDFTNVRVDDAGITITTKNENEDVIYEFNSDGTGGTKGSPIIFETDEEFWIDYGNGGSGLIELTIDLVIESYSWEVELIPNIELEVGESVIYNPIVKDNTGKTAPLSEFDNLNILIPTEYEEYFSINKNEDGYELTVLKSYEYGYGDMFFSIVDENGWQEFQSITILPSDELIEIPTRTYSKMLVGDKGVLFDSDDSFEEGFNYQEFYEVEYDEQYVDVFWEDENLKVITKELTNESTIVKMIYDDSINKYIISYYIDIVDESYVDLDVNGEDVYGKVNEEVNIPVTLINNNDLNYGSMKINVLAKDKVLSDEEFDKIGEIEVSELSANNTFHSNLTHTFNSNGLYDLKFEVGREDNNVLAENVNEANIIEDVVEEPKPEPDNSIPLIPLEPADPIEEEDTTIPMIPLEPAEPIEEEVVTIPMIPLEPSTPIVIEEEEVIEEVVEEKEEEIVEEVVEEEVTEEMLSPKPPKTGDGSVPLTYNYVWLVLASLLFVLYYLSYMSYHKNRREE